MFLLGTHKITKKNNDELLFAWFLFVIKSKSNALCYLDLAKPSLQAVAGQDSDKCGWR